ncbi:unnamed protein product [Mytilus edulis]|uniref:Uncharacterized protein n=1 Tax=Mytilus edulis TaxID=6550 RepID=A0A8S3QND7_MYTED|nr:unnamed protein product [Mytilus edulis]
MLNKKEWIMTRELFICNISDLDSYMNRETLKSDIKSTGTYTSGYTDDDFSGSSICPKYGLSDANNEHLDPKLCENKPVDSFQIGQGNSHRQSLFDQDSKPTSDLQFSCRNSPRPPLFNLDDDRQTGTLDIVVQLQHNYHATLGRDVDFNTKQRSRRVTWKDENHVDENSYYQYEEKESVRQLATSFRKPDNQSLQNESKALRDF